MNTFKHFDTNTNMRQMNSKNKTFDTKKICEKLKRLELLVKITKICKTTNNIPNLVTHFYHLIVKESSIVLKISTNMIFGLYMQ